MTVWGTEKTPWDFVRSAFDALIGNPQVTLPIVGMIVAVILYELIKR